uniref:Uncharacterized protein n=1 Tax=Octopus bimaculoides TaxID=37653 RepID=A0A0L8G1S8_OCTBM
MKVNEVIKTTKEKIYSWAGHIEWLKDNRWTIGVTKWMSRKWTTSRGQPMAGW